MTKKPEKPKMGRPRKEPDGLLKPVSIRFSAPTKATLEERAAARGIDVASLVRELVGKSLLDPADALGLPETMKAEINKIRTTRMDQPDQAQVIRELLANALTRRAADVIK